MRMKWWRRKKQQGEWKVGPPTGRIVLDDAKIKAVSRLTLTEKIKALRWPLGSLAWIGLLWTVSVVLGPGYAIGMIIAGAVIAAIGIFTLMYLVEKADIIRKRDKA